MRSSNDAAAVHRIRLVGCVAVGRRHPSGTRRDRVRGHAASRSQVSAYGRSYTARRRSPTGICVANLQLQTVAVFSDSTARSFV